MSLVSIIVELLLGWIASIIAGLFLPAPFPLVVGVIVFIVVAFGDRLGANLR